MEFNSQTPLTNLSVSSSQSTSRMENVDMEQHIEEEKEVEVEDALREVLMQLDSMQIDKIVQDEVSKVIAGGSLKTENMSGVLDEQIADFNTAHQLIVANEEIISDWSQRIEELQRKVKGLQVMRPLSQRMWRVPNFTAHYNNAKDNITTMINSPFMFTHEYGYKIGITLLPYGDKKTRGKYMSLFFCLVNGQFDSLQLWPFCLPIRFTLMDHHPDPDLRQNVNREFVPNPDPANEVFLGRPELKNPSLGFPKFISLDQLFHSERHYIEDDVIQIQVHIDTGSVVPL